MIHRWMSARVKRGTNIIGKAGQPVCQVSQTKRKIAAGFNPQRGYKRGERRQKKGGGGGWPENDKIGRVWIR